CALENQIEYRPYGNEVKYILNTDNYIEYLDMAKKINEDRKITIIVVHHEFSLFSGEYGENLLYFLYDLNKPIIVHFHTVVTNPDHRMIYIVNAIITVSAGILVNSEQAKKSLIDEYEIEPEKIHVMHFEEKVAKTSGISFKAHSPMC
ncbi:MAG: glycosyltransferase family 4 protein, partial [Saprospiraceae bacterium]